MTTTNEPKSKIMAVRLPIDDWRELDAFIRANGYETRNDGLRVLLLGAMAFLQKTKGEI